MGTEVDESAPLAEGKAPSMGVYLGQLGRAVWAQRGQVPAVHNRKGSFSLGAHTIPFKGGS